MPSHLNVEIKARCLDPDRILRRLAEFGAVEQGLDHQADTYFTVPEGRLKLRAGAIENALIFYRRSDQPGPKDSDVHLLRLEPTQGSALHEVLAAALGCDVVVDKQRRILWIDNVKFHVDDVTGLGSLVEIEAIDQHGDIGRARLLAQCESYLQLLEIADDDLESRSYRELVPES